MKLEKIPVEVIVKFSTNGEIRPLKLFYSDQSYIIDKIYNPTVSTPKGCYSMAIKYKCLIGGKIKTLYYDRYNNIWFLQKSIPNQNIDYNPFNYDC